jgi:hypothetical protein
MRNRDWKNRMREFRSCGSVGEPMGNHRLYPAEDFILTLAPAFSNLAASRVYPGYSCR